MKKPCNTERERERVRREIKDEEKKVKMIENEFDMSNQLIENVLVHPILVQEIFHRLVLWHSQVRSISLFILQ